MIYTTIHIQVSLQHRLCSISRTMGIPLSSIIITLLKRNAVFHADHGRAWIRIRYQPRQKGREWTRMHLRLSPAEYEFLLDLRRVHKRSVSSLISISADKYLDEMLNNTSPVYDKNRVNAYTFSKLHIDGATCWMHIWGIPDNNTLFHHAINNTA